MKTWFKYIKPYIGYFILGPICMIIEVIGEVLMPKFLATVINLGSAFQNTGTYISELSATILNGGTVEQGSVVAEKLMKCIGYLDHDGLNVIGYNIMTAIENADMSALSGYLSEADVLFASLSNSPYIWQTIGVACLMVLTALLMIVGGVGGAYFGAKAAINFAADLRLDLYKKVQGFSFSNIDKFSTGSLVTRLTNDVTQLQNFINMLLRMCLRAPGMLIGALIMAIVLKPQLATVLLVTVPLMMAGTLFIVTRGFPKFAKMQDKVDALNSTVQENITNIRVVKSFVREDYQEEKFRQSNANLKKSGMSAQLNMILLSPVVTLSMNITTVAILWFGGQMVIGNTMEIGDLSAFLTYVTQILSSLTMLTMVLMFSSRALASAKRIKEVLEEVPDISDIDAKYTEKEITRGEIEFKNVSFRYFKNSPDLVLKNINLKIEAGKTVGIIGSTGCGKTTLVSMIPRLYDADEGDILVDGVSVKDYSLVHLRDKIGMVLQKNLLFSGSVLDNLRWGDSDATLDEVRQAAEYAQANKFIDGFTEGYDKMIDQGGVNVSGGQQQRLCIARALLKKPTILILDDSTSAVDTATEAQIRKAFKEELNESTKIIIAQRITSVKDADVIIVMDDGCITGIGTHDELIVNNEEYREIYYSQQERKEENK